MTDTIEPAVAGAQPTADAKSSVIDTIFDAATKPTEDAKPPEPQEPEGKEEAFPKKAINAISYRDKKIGRLQAELAAERAAKTALEQKYVKPETPPANTGEPKETDYKTYAEYLEARQDWKLDQKLAEKEAKSPKPEPKPEAKQEQTDDPWEKERGTHIAKQAQEFAKEHPDHQALVDEYAEVIDDFSPQIKRLFLEADNAPLAFYNLAKEGKLEDLVDMSLAKAAMEIGRAQTQAPQKPKSKAPAPLPAARGSVASSKTITDMNQDELYRWFKQP